MRPDEARVMVTLRDGSRHEAYVAHALGSIQRPMSEDDLSEKFRDRKSTRLLQSLMRLSYAVFCLKTNNSNTTYDQPNSEQTIRTHKHAILMNTSRKKAK